MTKISTAFLLAACLSALGAEWLPQAEFIEEWRISKAFTLAVAAAMPEDRYSFKATPEEMSFGRLMTHIAESSVYRFRTLTGKPAPKWLGTQVIDSSKPEVLKVLNESFDYVLEALPTITDKQLLRRFDVRWEGRPIVNGRQMMLNMFVHVAHHRAQAEVYLRLNGVVPPTYRF